MKTSRQKLKSSRQRSKNSRQGLRGSRLGFRPHGRSRKLHGKGEKLTARFKNSRQKVKNSRRGRKLAGKTISWLVIARRLCETRAGCFVAFGLCFYRAFSSSAGARRRSTFTATCRGRPRRFPRGTRRLQRLRHLRCKWQWPRPIALPVPLMNEGGDMGRVRARRMIVPGRLRLCSGQRGCSMVRCPRAGSGGTGARAKANGSASGRETVTSSW